MHRRISSELHPRTAAHLPRAQQLHEHAPSPVEAPLGHPSRALDDAALSAEFVDGAGRARRPLPAARAQRIAAEVLALHQAPCAQRVLALLSPDGWGTWIKAPATFACSYDA